MKIQCQCGAGYQVKPELVGRKVTCKKCSAIFLIAAPSASLQTKPGSGQVAPKQSSVQKAPPSFSGQPQQSPAQKAPPSFSGQSKQPRAANQARKEREEALLAGYASKPAKQSLEDRIAERHRDSIERDRSTNSIKYILIGLLCIAAGVATFFIFRALDDGGVAPVVVWVLKWIGGKYWIPPLLALIGIWQIAIGIMSLLKVVDIDQEEQFPTNF